MAFDAVNYIVQKLKEYDSTIDVNPGSVVRDFLINPMSSLLESYVKAHTTFENRLSLLSFDTLSEEALDDIASNFLVSRSQGSQATGYVRIYFRDAQDIVIPANTEFRSKDGRTYYSTKEITVSRSQMQGNIERYPLYSTGDILVRSLLKGLSYELGPGQITSVTNLGKTYAYVTNLVAFTGASDRDTNTQLLEKILVSAYSSTVASVAGISKTLKENFSNITDTYVVGAGHTLMQRDTIQNTSRSDVTSFTYTDFNGKIKGYNTAPYNLNRAYYGLLVDPNLNNSGFLNSEFISPTSFTREYSQNDYSKLFAADSAITAITPSQVLVYETFEASGYDSNWTTSDEYMGVGTLLYSGEIRLLNNAIYMGNDPDRAGVFLPYQTILLISGYLDEMATLA